MSDPGFSWWAPVAGFFSAAFTGIAMIIAGWLKFRSTKKEISSHDNEIILKGYKDLIEEYGKRIEYLEEQVKLIRSQRDEYKEHIQHLETEVERLKELAGE